jgi:hypothetical protein
MAANSNSGGRRLPEEGRMKKAAPDTERTHDH